MRINAPLNLLPNVPCLRLLACAVIGLTSSLSTAMPQSRVGEFDLSALPTYSPEHRVSGLIRFHGNAYGGLIQKWQAAFQRHHPGATFQNTLPSSDTAFPALVTGVTDFAPNGSEPALVEWLSFFEVFGYHATDIIVGTGTFDTPGRSPGIVIMVHKENPLNGLSVDQLDGIFGAERNGSLVGFKWKLENARGADKNIRTWGQLGLTGEWADKPINTYGHAPTGAARFFQLHVLLNSDKWNPNFQGFVETGSKMISDTDQQQLGGVRHMLAKLLANDKYGIAWTIMPQAQGIDGIKALALAPRGGEEHIQPNPVTFQSRAYPLTRNIYIYLNHKPGTPLAPDQKEFLRFVLSREGQELVRDESGFLPLTATLVEEQRRRLE